MGKKQTKKKKHLQIRFTNAKKLVFNTIKLTFWVSCLLVRIIFR